MFWNLAIAKELHEIKLLCAWILEGLLTAQGIKPDEAKDCVLILLWLKDVEDVEDEIKKRKQEATGKKRGRPRTRK